MRTIIVLAALVVAGCGVSAPPPVSAADVAALETGVSIAETLALNYTRLPVCPAATKVCADPAIKAKIKLDGARAHDAAVALRISSAAGLSSAYAAAVAALAALEADTPAVPVVISALGEA